MLSPLKKRNAGILLSVTSLPSPYGIGDLGPEAFSFAEFLYSSHQSYWQILPITPIDESQSYSPYSSASTFAGNPLLISPDKLVTNGLLKKEDLIPFRVPVTSSVNYQEAFKIKNRLLEKAFANFQTHDQEAFKSFCDEQAHWLDDFALYSVLKNHFNDSPWHQWHDHFRSRNPESLRTFASTHSADISKIKWLQFIFFSQWHELKAYCNKLNVHILGDLPFYMSYDSADVWAHPEIFKLTKEGAIAGVAGVPPDYFNEDGQLWGMPVYRWDVMEEQEFSWWVSRIRKNLEIADVLRLDHFRAFSTFWEVPANSKTAKKGKWKRAPGKKLFKKLQQEFESLPFVAEDLGDISEDVYQLRDFFKLHGMKVLQFAFGKTMPESDHIPHNFSSRFFAYTGTHDNNTTLGWFKN
jgi:4-alpha-glucanotransferase